MWKNAHRVIIIIINPFFFHTVLDQKITTVLHDCGSLIGKRVVIGHSEMGQIFKKFLSNTNIIYQNIIEKKTNGTNDKFWLWDCAEPPQTKTTYSISTFRQKNVIRALW